jgi:hypothetical protein
MDGGWLLVLSFSRRFFFQPFFLAINIPVQSYSPLRVLRRSILTAVMRSFPFSYFTNHCCERLRFNVARDYASMLREITLQCCERLRFNVARDYASMLREITLRCYERLHFIIMRYHASLLLRLHSYFNYTIRRKI